jgi:hypothetical protein
MEKRAAIPMPGDSANDRSNINALTFARNNLAERQKLQPNSPVR